ncbi:fucose 4-O-acetylase-like acetyltransferase [Rhodovulum steppense]|uniref:Fucose 4-O-acetylase-like acetyltransferase n=2 Tax=Rhodovulum steppense TaxID=540251 RepID=A0A4V2R3B5_9RHOB|nr:acyltransferase [Rhodovulum steppense]TCM75877.1 fucose 4-O-acetylase-like acetyltransferase [Rhodovulum steppense]
MASSAQRLAWIDSTKGVAIVLVVFGHAWRGCHDAGLFAGMPPGFFEAVDTRIYAFHMPLFFLISGLFLLPSLAHRGPATFLKDRLARLFYPMLLWTYVFAGSKLLAGQFANHPLALSDFPLLPIPGQWQYWFLWALLLMHVGVLLLRPILLSERFGRAALWGLLAASLALQAAPLPPSLIFWTSNAPAFLPYLVMGMLLGEHGGLRKAGPAAGMAATGIFVLVLAFMPALNAVGLPRVVTAALLCLAMLGSVSWLSGRFSALGAGLAALGAASMIIFLSHTLFSASLRIGLLAAGIGDLVLHLVAGSLVGLLLPLLLKRAAERTGRSALIGV